jgi:hypothetical protein
VTDHKLRRLAEQVHGQYGLVTRQQLLAADLGRAWVDRFTRQRPTILPGIYAQHPTDDFRQRAMAAVLHWPGACLSHACAGRIRGWSEPFVAPAWSHLGPVAMPYIDGWPDDQVDLTVTTGRPRGAPGYRIHHGPTGQPVEVAGLPVCGGLETALQIARTTPLCYSVPLLDALCREDHRRLSDLSAGVERRAGRRGIIRARQAVSLTDPLAESVLESLGRLLLVLGGLPAPTVQLVVRVRGARYRADLGYEKQRVLLEFDGREDHERWDDVASDMARQNALVNAGWTVLRFTWAQVLFKPDVVLRTIREALIKGARV